MIETYKQLSLALLKSRKSLTLSCKELEVDPELVDVSQLDVIACDNCGYWDTPKTMFFEPDNTQYCKTCQDLYYMKY